MPPRAVQIAASELLVPMLLNRASTVLKRKIACLKENEGPRVKSADKEIGWCCIAIATLSI